MVRRTIQKGDLFFDCSNCGKMPKTLVKTSRKIGPGPWEKIYWQFTCPLCTDLMISYLWVK